jgi:hypothetical protein
VVATEGGCVVAAPGTQVLNELHETFRRYVVFPDEHCAVGVVLWTATTHALQAFQHAPRLVINSPEKRCGKSRLLDIIAGTCHAPLMSVNATVAAIYRSIGENRPPTLLVDEADTLFGSNRVAEQNEDLRALLNAGHQRGRPALRCVGPNQIPTEFSTFAMAALAGIGEMPDTITDRAVNVTLRRRSRDEKVSQFRTRRDGPLLTALRDGLAAWCAEQLDALADAEPEMPVEDRAADTWEPLVALADAAGGRWPELARSACMALVARAENDSEDGSLRVRLLSDIRDVFAKRDVPFLASADLVSELRDIEESPWDGFDFNPSKLSRRLKDYGVKPRRDATGNTRGYRIDDLADVFVRYLRQNPSETSGTCHEQVKSPDTLGPSDTFTRQTESTRQTKAGVQDTCLTALTGSDGSSGRYVPTPAAMPSTTAVKPGRTTAARRQRTYRQQPPDRHPSCIVCGKPVVAGQGDTHLSCKTGVAS